MLYNPYEGLDSAKWLKANFHGHSRVWWGLTYGFKSEANELIKKYDELEYDIAGISDYQYINPKSDIPVYEHGTGIFKNHQLSIGAKNVLWKDYLFFQNFHHKQNIISELHEEGNVISVNHPDMRGAYSAHDLINLRGFELLEVVNHNYSKTLNLWDSVLSNGNLLFVIVNDDTHDITNPKDFGYSFTYVNSNSRSTPDVVNALKKGLAFGVEMEPQGDFSQKTKLTQSANVPILMEFIINNDSITIRFDKLCDTIKFIGQNGVIASKIYNTASAFYKFKPDDTYIRTEVNQKDLTNLLLNPVIRYNGGLKRTPPEINQPMTWLFRSICLIIAAIGIFIAYKRKKSVDRAKS